MKWKEHHSATKQGNLPYQSPHYEEDEWWTSFDVKKEIARRTGEHISLSRIGKIAKVLGLVKDSGQGFKLYHKKVVEVICREYL